LPTYTNLTDYLKSEPEFLKRVEQDALTFKPLGTKIASYTRRAGGTKGKGKTRADIPLTEDDEDAVVFEVYHVSYFFLFLNRILFTVVFFFFLVG